MATRNTPVLWSCQYRRCFFRTCWRLILVRSWGIFATRSVLLLIHNSSLALRGFVLRGIAPITQTNRSDPSVDKTVKTVRKIEEVFEPCCTMLKEFKMDWGGGGGGKKHLLQCFCKKKTLSKQNIVFVWGGGGSRRKIFPNFFFSRGEGEEILGPNSRKKYIYLNQLRYMVRCNLKTGT
jgi:hypothetical protein